jgi:lysozyme
MDKRFIDWLKILEGFRSKPYTCTQGKLSIAYGRNLQDVGVSRPEGDYLLLNDIAFVEGTLDKYPWYQHLDDNRKNVVSIMAYQLGVEKLLSFKRFIIALMGQEYDLAAKEMLNSKWYSQTPARAKALSEIMSSGQFTIEF